MIIERVIYCALSGVTALNPLPHETLLKRDDGIVAALADEALRTLISQSAPVSILYFSKENYQQATRGLTQQQIRDVIDRRLKTWAPNAADQAVNSLFLQEQRCLTLTALARTGASGKNTDTLQSHWGRTIDTLVGLSSDGRYDDLSLSEILVIALEKETELMVELRDAAAEGVEGGIPEEKAALENEARLRDQAAKALAAVLVKMGKSEYRDSLPQVNIFRGVWIRPRDSTLIAALDIEFEAHVDYREGFVSRWRLRRLPNVQSSGKKVAVFYFDGGQFLESLAETTPAQLTRDFSELEALTPAAKTRMRVEFLDSLRLQQLLLKKALRPRIAAENQSALADLDGQIQRDSENLLLLLVKHKTWLGDKPPPEPARAQLLGAEEALVRDVAFFQALARQQGRDHLEKRLLSLGQSKAADVARIKNGQPNPP